MRVLLNSNIEGSLFKRVSSLSLSLFHFLTLCHACLYFPKACTYYNPLGVMALSLILSSDIVPLDSPPQGVVSVSPVSFVLPIHALFLRRSLYLSLSFSSGFTDGGLVKH